MKKLFMSICISFTLLGYICMYAESQESPDATEGYPVSVLARLESGERLASIENRLAFLLGEVGYPVRDDSFILLDTLVSVDRVFPLENPPRVMVDLKISIQVKDADSGDICATMSGTASGGGVDENEAVFSGVQRINVDKEVLASMMMRCSDFYIQIRNRRENLSLRYYKEAQEAKNAKNYREALRRLRMVYPGTQVAGDAQMLVENIRRMMPKPVIAVLKFKTNSSSIADNFRDVLTTVLVKDAFKVLEREQLSGILGEQRMELDGLIDPATAGEYGRLTGADFLLLGRLTASGNGIEVNARVVRVRTGQIVSMFQTQDSRDNQERIARGIVDEIWYAVESGGLDEAPSDDTSDPEIVVGMDAPRVMIMIPEEHIHRPVPYPDPAGETEMIRKFINSGFRVVDQAQVAKLRATKEGKAAAKGDTQSAIAIARQSGAEVILIGEAFSENVPRPGNQLQTCSARVEVRAIQTDTGIILAANGKEAHSTDATEAVAAKKALRTAGGLLADDMIKQIIKGWERSGGLSRIEVSVRGIEYSQLISLQKFLEEQEGVTDVKRRNFDEGVATIEITSKNSIQDMADALALAEFAGFAVKIEAVKANTIEISASQK